MAQSKPQQAILGILSPGFGGTSLPDYMRRYLDFGLGGITLFGSNTPDFESTVRIVEEIRSRNPNCVISIDEEAGDVTRIWARSGSPYPSPYLLGRVDDVGLTQRVFANLGAALSQAGVDMTFGPVLDLTVSMDNPIVGVRSFGADPELVARHGSAAVMGLQAAGIQAAAKHFPGHGDTSADSHHDLPAIQRSLAEMRARDLVPFQAAIAAGVRAIMVGHLLVPAVDSVAASLSGIWSRDILRAELGFEGLVVTDALDMGAVGGIPKIDRSAISAMRAGADLLCLSGIADQEAIVEAILREAEIVLTDSDLVQIQNSVARLRASRAMEPPSFSDSHFDPSDFTGGLQWHGDLSLDRASTAVLTLEASPTVASGVISWGVEESLVSNGYGIGQFDTAKTRIVQFRDAWRDSIILERLEMMRAEHPDALFIDFGWPTLSFEPKNLIRAFGASRAHADSVANLLRNFSLAPRV